MKRRTFVKTLSGLSVGVGPVFASTEALKPIILPDPEKEGGKSVMAALQERHTNRSISPRALPLQVLSNLLWAAFGVNRERASFGKAGRTAPSASNSQEIDLYVTLANGVYLYEAIPHHLKPVVPGDYRSRAGRRGASSAPVNIFYIADLSRYDLGPGQPDPHIGEPEVQKSYYYTDTGFIGQNVYLFAAAHGLVAWFHNCDHQSTPREFKLKSHQRVLFAQSVTPPEAPPWVIYRSGFNGPGFRSDCSIHRSFSGGFPGE
jgi:hypothetical protein